MQRQLLEAAHAAGHAGLDVASLSEMQRAVLAAGLPGLTLRGDRVTEAAAATTGMSDAAARALAALDAEPWSPPVLPPADRGALRELERAGLAVRAGDLWFSAAAVDAAASVLAELLAEHPGRCHGVSGAGGPRQQPEVCPAAPRSSRRHRDDTPAGRCAHCGGPTAS